MLPVDLTIERIRLEDGSRAYPYVWQGEEILIRDDARTVVRIYQLFSDTEIDEQDKAIKIINLIFLDPDDAFMCCDYDAQTFGKLISAVTWDIFGIDTTGKRTDTALWDLKEDAPFIRTSLRMAYGIDWDQICNAMSWTEFVYLIATLPYETPLGMRIYYRNKDNRPKRTKHNKEQITEFDRLHKLFALKQPTKQKGSHDSADVANNAMNDFALALRNSKR